MQPLQPTPSNAVATEVKKPEVQVATEKEQKEAAVSVEKPVEACKQPLPAQISRCKACPYKSVVSQSYSPNFRALTLDTDDNTKASCQEGNLVVVWGIRAIMIVVCIYQQFQEKDATLWLQVPSPEMLQKIPVEGLLLCLCF